jgi:negative regulator of flagellin synthesis FlgM
VNNLGASPQIAKLNPANSTTPPATPTSQAIDRGADRLDLSGVQNYMQVLRQNDIRADKVAEIRAQIDAGTYETDDKLEVAIDRLIDDL